jgi:thiamine-phosphate pyrophosphorylase
MNTFVTEIRLEYRNRIVLHSHTIIWRKALNSLHSFYRKQPKCLTRKQLETCKKQDFTLSTSTHSIEDFNELDPAFDYLYKSCLYTKENYHPKQIYLNR